MKEESSDIPLGVAKLTALFCSLAAALYAAMKIEPSPVVALALYSGPLLTVVLWLHKDGQRTGAAPFLDWGYFLLFWWPVVIPWYAFKTRGRKGWQLTAGLFALIAAPSISWWSVASVAWYFEVGA